MSEKEFLKPIHYKSGENLEVGDIVSICNFLQTNGTRGAASITIGKGLIVDKVTEINCVITTPNALFKEELKDFKDIHKFKTMVNGNLNFRNISKMNMLTSAELHEFKHLIPAYKDISIFYTANYYLFQLYFFLYCRYK